MSAQAGQTDDTGSTQQETPATAAVADPTSQEKQDTLTQSVGQTLPSTAKKSWWKRLTGS